METSNFKKMQLCGGCSNYKERPRTCMVYRIVGAFSGRIGVPLAVMGWAASYDGGP